MSRFLLEQVGMACCYNSDGTLAWKCPCGVPALNGITMAGLDAVLNGDAFGNSLYFGLISGNGFTRLSPSDTMASHEGWVEEYERYHLLTRSQWQYGMASGQSITGIGSAPFVFNAAALIKGFLVSGNPGKGGMDGLLFSTSLFVGGDRHVEVGQALNLECTLRAAASN